MSISDITSPESLKRPWVWLLALTAGLVAVQLTLVWKADEWDHFGMSVLFWGVAASLIHDRKDKLTFDSDRVSTLIGAGLIAGLLAYSTTMPGQWHNFHRLAPFVSVLALALLASGWRNLRQYWQELFIFFFLGIPRVLFGLMADISPITAKFSTFLLWYGGFDVQREGVFITITSTGSSVEVYSGCSGIEAMCYLLGLSSIFLVMFPTTRFQKFFVPIAGLVIGFFVNAIRVAIMATLAGTNAEAFDYWHVGDGSKFFALLSVAVFGAFCYGLVWLSDRQKSTPTHS